MEEEYVRKLGSEKKKDFDAELDKYLDLYIKKARAQGYLGKLKFKVEKGRVIIFVVI